MGAIAHWGIVIALVAILFFSPKWRTLKSRLPIAVVLLVLGCGEIFGGLALRDRAFMQGILLDLWLGSAVILIVLGIVLLSPSLQNRISSRSFKRRR